MGFVDTLRDCAQSVVCQIRKMLRCNPVGAGPIYLLWANRKPRSEGGGGGQATSEGSVQDNSYARGQRHIAEFMQQDKNTQPDQARVVYSTELRQPEASEETDSARAFVLLANDGMFYPGIAVGNIPFPELEKINSTNYADTEYGFPQLSGGIPDMSCVSRAELTMEAAKQKAYGLLDSYCEYMMRLNVPPDTDEIQSIWESPWEHISHDTEMKEHLGKSAEGYHYAIETSWKGGDSGYLTWSESYTDLKTAKVGLKEASNVERDGEGKREEAWEKEQIARFEAQRF